jgi:endonuclease/exonuclease/phosphatase family metal-dependent hydrolase
MFAKLESYLHALRRRLSRKEWAIRHLGLSRSEGTSEEPGLLLIQIDGFSRSQFERAVSGGRMPFLRRLLRRDGYHLHTFYSGLPSTTPAVQAELFYGVRAAVPAFSFYDRTKRCHGLMCYPEWAKEVEAVCSAQAEGLLKGGSSWSNIYTGGAALEETHFCAASLGPGDLWRAGKLRHLFIFIALHLPSVLYLLLLLALETVIGLWYALLGILRGERPGLELHAALSRVFVAIGLRDVITVGAAVDLARGLPIVHVNFVGYDEHAHRRGPGSAFAHWTLRGIDRSVRRLVRAASASSRRDYAVWIYSDHGQERANSVALRASGGIEEIIREALELAQARDPAWRPRSQHRPITPWLHRRGRSRHLAASAALTAEEQATFTVSAIGPVGHVYFAHTQTEERLRSLARRLVEKHGVPGVLWKTERGGVVWTHAGHETAVPEDVPALLPHPKEWRDEIANDLAAMTANAHAGDLVLLGWAPGAQPMTFAPEHGAHAGMGLEETRGFVLLPARTRLPAGTEHFIRPAALRAAALHVLGRGPLEMSQHVPISGETMEIRVMTYNTHSCGGTDGRVSPRRIARVIERHGPDIVALQELDLGRRRSRAEDQATIIANMLGLHLVFCPTITRGDEHYGHALLSRWPIEIVRRGFLPGAPGGWWPEPRSALWARILLGARRINVITTHLGLGTQERHVQMQALLGSEWVRAVPPDEDVILCGDFNAMPGSPPYALAAAQMRDVQVGLEEHRPLRTFSSWRPFARIDHIFVSAGLIPQRALVPRGDLTRVASDHLPLIADVVTAPAAAETPMRKPA